MKRGILREDIQFGDNTLSSLFKHFISRELEIHGMKEGSSYLCKKHRRTSSGAASNPNMMNASHDFIIFTVESEAYYRKNNTDFLWVEASFFEEVSNIKDRPNREMKHILLSMGE